jgi:hypothetical protein
LAFDEAPRLALSGAAGNNVAVTEEVGRGLAAEALPVKSLAMAAADLGSSGFHSPLTPVKGGGGTGSFGLYSSFTPVKEGGGDLKRNAFGLGSTSVCTSPALFGGGLLNGILLISSFVGIGNCFGG